MTMDSIDKSTRAIACRRVLDRAKNRGGCAEAEAQDVDEPMTLGGAWTLLLGNLDLSVFSFTACCSLEPTSWYGDSSL